MATPGGPLGTLGSALLAAGLMACGGPPVGSKVPRPDPAPIAVGAAAAAAALTLANPDLAGQKPTEQDDGRAPRESKEPRVTVPGEVLDRAQSDKPDPAARRPCKAASASASDSGVSLVPTAHETAPSTAPPPLERPDCEPPTPAPARDQ
jgi:hypothetical protein